MGGLTKTMFLKQVPELYLVTMLTNPLPLAVSDIKKEPKKLREFWNLDMSIYMTTAIVDNYIKRSVRT